jgi:hypothetical protein
VGSRSEEQRELYSSSIRENLVDLGKVRVTDKTNAPATIDAYIAGFPEEVQEKLEEVRSTIKRAAPEAEEAIKYQIPTFMLEGILVHFADYR